MDFADFGKKQLYSALAALCFIGAIHACKKDNTHSEVPQVKPPAISIIKGKRVSKPPTVQTKKTVSEESFYAKPHVLPDGSVVLRGDNDRQNEILERLEARSRKAEMIREKFAEHHNKKYPNSDIPSIQRMKGNLNDL